MPTPRPIIDTSNGVIVLMSVKPARMNSSRNAVMSATIASASGIAVATSVRKTMSSTMSAASSPRSSCVPCSIGGNSASPLNSAVTPAAATASRTASSTATTCVAVLRLDRLRELRLRVRDAPVVGERLLAERVADAVDARLVRRRSELRRLELRDRGLDGRLALWRVQPLALRRGEHEVQDGALLGRELRLDEVGRLLGVGARDLELVLQAATDGGDEHDERGDDAEPREDDAPRVRRARAHPVRETSGGQSFVCCETIVLLRHAQPPSSRCGYDPPASRKSSVDCVNRGQRTRHPISSLLPTADLGYSTA